MSKMMLLLLLFAVLIKISSQNEDVAIGNHKPSITIKANAAKDAAAIFAFVIEWALYYTPGGTAPMMASLCLHDLSLIILSVASCFFPAPHPVIP